MLRLASTSAVSVELPQTERDTERRVSSRYRLGFDPERDGGL